MERYYDSEWVKKLKRPEYATIEARWRSRWEFANKYIEPNSIVLDGGCGDGVLGEILLQEKKCKVYGLDISHYAMNLAQARGVDIRHCDISFDRFPFDDNYFDRATFLCSLEHVIDPIHALLETCRVVKPQGKILVTLPNAVYFIYRLYFLKGVVPQDFLHIKIGEGMHIQFYNYNNEFEDRVLSKISQIKILQKIPDLKNPKKYGMISRAIMRLILTWFPNLFAQYTHWVLEVKK